MHFYYPAKWWKRQGAQWPCRPIVHQKKLWAGSYLADAVEKQPREEFHVRWGGAAPGRVGGDSAHAHMYLPRSRVAGPATLPVSSRRVGHLSAQQRVAWHRTTWARFRSEGADMGQPAQLTQGSTRPPTKPSPGTSPGRLGPGSTSGCMQWSGDGETSRGRGWEWRPGGRVEEKNLEASRFEKPTETRFVWGETNRGAERRWYGIRRCG
jgi:hypothetical protein